MRRGTDPPCHPEASLKEIRLRPGIAPGDLGTKLAALEKFIDEGESVRLTVLFRGREIVHTKLGERLIFELAARVGAKAALQNGTHLEGKRMHATLVPRKRRG